METVSAAFDTGNILPDLRKGSRDIMPQPQDHQVSLRTEMWTSRFLSCTPFRRNNRSK